MGSELTIAVLLGFMIVGALVAVETRALISSVISLGVVGMGVSIAFLLLAAPDLAIVQVAVEVISVIFLIRATIGREVSPTREQIQWPALLALFFLATRELGVFGEPIMSRVASAPSNRYLAQGLKETGSANLVTSIILDYRGYDTLGEATVLFAAVVGTLAILRGRARKGGK
jgi:multicomponent Na+:H+ antiporter subunit B